MPKVSVIIPTHNRAEYLRTAIASVLNQTFQDFETIVVDDASTDETCEVVRGFSTHAVKYLRHETNKGGAAARNTGIVNSNGEYIAFLDDDDEWLPEKLQMQITLLETDPPEISAVYTGYTIVDRRSGSVTWQKVPSKSGHLYNELLAGNCIGGTSAVLLKRKCFKKIGLFDANLPSFQDYDMWIRIAKEFRIGCIKEPLYKYYLHGNQIWTDLDAIIRGLQMMVRKYANSPGFKRYFSNCYLRLGVQYSDLGDLQRSRDLFCEAIKLYPFEPRHYFHLGLSLLGSKNSKKIRELWI